MMETLKDALSGFGGAVCCVYIGFPFDSVKTRMQAAKPGVYRGLVDCAAKGLKEGGVRGIYRGATPALASACIENAVLFAANGFFVRLFTGSSDEDNAPLSTLALCGGLAGIFSSTTITPAELVKVRLQVDKGTPVACIRNIVRQDGFGGLFRGIQSLWLRDVPFNVLFLASYELFCRLLAGVQGLEGRHNLDPASLFLAGGLAGISGWATIFPMDVVKTHMQSSTRPLPLSVAVRELHAEAGVRRFYRGLPAACLRAFPANAGLFVGYELTSRLLHGGALLGAGR